MKSTDKDKHILQLRRNIKSTLQDLKTFQKISSDKANIIMSQDLHGKTLSKKNEALLEKFNKVKKSKSTEQQLDILSEILFRNFSIQESTIEILKAYTDEYYDRFKVIDESLSKTLSSLDKVMHTIK